MQRCETSLELSLKVSHYSRIPVIQNSYAVRFYHVLKTPFVGESDAKFLSHLVGAFAFP
jgi:hypothetical protein